MEEEPRPRLRGKKNRILDLYEKEPDGGVVVCYDEFGPMELRPIHGTGWFAKKRPARLRTTYNRLHGTEQLLAFYDVHADCLEGVVRKRKTARDILSAFKRLRACYPAGVRIYLIMDNLSVHKQKDIARFMEDNNMEAVWTPTYSSWLNAIEAHFCSLSRSSS